jgi:hypothetical protein
MGKLLKIGSHGNSIAVLFLHQHQIYRKFAHSKKAVNALKQECEGIKWYAQQQSLENSKLDRLSLTLNGHMLDIPELPGKKVSCEASINCTGKFILKAINHYNSVWPKLDKAPVHGDLTLDNILFYGERVNFFDWEHFNKDGEIWGFDIVYLALSAILLNDLKKTVISFEESFLLITWQKLLKIGVNPTFLARPLGTIIDIYKTNRKWSSIVADSPEKLFPLILSSNQVQNLDTYFSDITAKLT